MRFGKVVALVACFVAAVALGIAISPYVRDRIHRAKDTAATNVSEPAPAAANADTKDKPRAVASRTGRVKDADRKPAAPVATVDLSAEEFHKRMKPVMNRGTNLSLASDGFRDAEQFATVAHAAHNTKIPFAVLKHRVLVEGKTLAQAIRESDANANAVKEVRMAREQARQDVTEIAAEIRESKAS
jgi:hypothetical protein